MGKVYVSVADELGHLKAQIAGLTKRERELKRLLIESGVDIDNGVLFRAVVVRSDQRVVDWASIAKVLKVSRQLLRAHTTIRERFTVRVVARVRDQEKAA